MSVTNLFARSYFFHRVGTRSMFTSSKYDTNSPNWLRVGLAFGSSIFLWSLFLKQHSTDLLEYKLRNQIITKLDDSLSGHAPEIKISDPSMISKWENLQ
ncbi:NADH dehydrogenase [ubiquinone] 1 subunit C1, mitochondrial isoform X2 [Syngnathoides biaculeatus]|uniref:NADH dehydrogenase [ubiquinone] 1 subunit C1, mitochondrial isoform X2 n=1 Tax=Syngnathoides biaculeatus TaxID=300417 RepID=UPI002ADE881E|nr:NADH dehydrogenase [ubiquinone] 1 subunit C1, mitochondrial isoform X2 [Syngnathoides biaculeatus]